MMQGLAGWQSLTGDPDGPPTKSGLSLVDLSGGYASTIALLAGLWRARRDGVGCDCDVSLFETALHELMYIGPWAATHGYVPPRRRNSAHPSIVPFQNFRAADGWIVVAAAKQKFWERLCEVIGEPELADGSALRDDRRARRAPRRARADPRAACSRARTVRRVARRARDGGRPGGEGEHGRSRRSPSRRPRRAATSSSTSIRRSARCGTIRHRRSGSRPTARRSNARRRAARSAASTPTRCSPELCGYPPERIAARCARRASSARRRCRRRERARPRRLRRDAARPAVARRRAARAQLRPQLRGGRREHAARGRPGLGVVPARGRRRAADGRPAEPEHRVDVRVRQPRRLLARAPDLRQARAADDRLRGRPGARAEPEAARAMVAAGWEVASHGWRWIDYLEMSEDEEREHMRRAIAGDRGRHRRSAPSAGTRAGSRTTRAASSSRRAASSTTRTPTPTSCPTGSRSPGSSTS